MGKKSGAFLVGFLSRFIRCLLKFAAAPALDSESKETANMDKMRGLLHDPRFGAIDDAPHAEVLA
jgi:hypothetical protein